jgi:hypothetical protein
MIAKEGSTAERRCPKCGARLTIERLDHHLTGHERMFCPRHGEIGTLQAMTARDYERTRYEADDDA